MIRILPLLSVLLLTALSAHAQTPDAGRQLFQARCASCHGEDGLGGGRGFNIVSPAQPRATSAQAIRELILRGVPNAGMPGFVMPDAEVDAIVVYLTSLRAAAGAVQGFGVQGSGVQGSSAQRFEVPSLPFSEVAHPQNGAWPTYHGSLTGNRFSPLDQITVDNVQRLAPAWMFTLRGAPRALQATPVVVGGVMYVRRSTRRTRWTRAAAGRSGITAARARPVWPATPPAASIAAWRCSATGCSGHRQRASAGAPPRSPASWCGTSRWRITTELRRHQRPLVVDDLVISGISGGDEGVRGFLDAYRVDRRARLAILDRARTRRARIGDVGWAARWNMGARRRG